MRTIEISKYNIDLSKDIWKNYVIIYDWLINIMKKALDFLKKYKKVKNSWWIKKMENIICKIETY